MSIRPCPFQGPSTVQGPTRLVSHPVAGGLLALDRRGFLERYDPVHDVWSALCRAPYADFPRYTSYVLPMPYDRRLYVLRATFNGYSDNDGNFELHDFDLETDSWKCDGTVNGEEVQLDDKERFHGYAAGVGWLVLKTATGEPKVRVDLPVGSWTVLSGCRRCDGAYGGAVSSDGNSVGSVRGGGGECCGSGCGEVGCGGGILPEFVYDVWGGTEAGCKAVVVARTSNPYPQAFVVDWSRGGEVRVTREPREGTVSGLMCRVNMKREEVGRIADML